MGGPPKTYLFCLGGRGQGLGGGGLGLLVGVRPNALKALPSNRSIVNILARGISAVVEIKMVGNHLPIILTRILLERLVIKTITLILTTATIAIVIAIVIVIFIKSHRD